MPLLNDDVELVRIDLPHAGEWVDVLPHLSLGQQTAIRKAAVRGSSLTGSGAQIDSEKAIEATTFAVLETAVKRWSFPEPVTPENIRRLDAASGAVIQRTLNRLYTLPDDEKNGSSGSGSTTPSVPVALPQN